MSASTETPGAAGLIPEGKAAPAFTLPDQQGDKHKLADYKGKWVVLYFYPKESTVLYKCC